MITLLKKKGDISTDIELSSCFVEFYLKVLDWFKILFKTSSIKNRSQFQHQTLWEKYVKKADG
jgi:hypothetical protein